MLSGTKGTISKATIAYLIAAFVTAFAFFVLSMKCYPNCAFETQRWSKLAAWRDWAVKGFWGAVVFKIILISLVRYFFPSLTAG